MCVTGIDGIETNRLIVDCAQQVENETLKKSLTEKNGLLAQASSAIEELESQQRASQVVHQSEKQSLEEQLQSLQKVPPHIRSHNWFHYVARIELLCLHFHDF